MPLTTNQRTDLIRCYHQAGNSLTGGLRQYRREKKLKKGPCCVSAFKNLLGKFQAHGSVLNLKSSGRPSVNDVEVAEVLETAKELSKENVHNVNSAREVARRLSKPYSTVTKILRKTLKLYPYHLKRVHELLPQDTDTRLDFALKCLAEIDTSPLWLPNIFWTDEAHFHLHGGVNTRCEFTHLIFTVFV